MLSQQPGDSVGLNIRIMEALASAADSHFWGAVGFSGATDFAELDRKAVAAGFAVQALPDFFSAGGPAG